MAVPKENHLFFLLFPVEVLSYKNLWFGGWGEVFSGGGCSKFRRKM